VVVVRFTRCDPNPSRGDFCEDADPESKMARSSTRAIKVGVALDLPAVPTQPLSAYGSSSYDNRSRTDDRRPALAQARQRPGHGH